jgi:acetyl-CoA carboxylase biotin carboxyl carrier protein
MRYPDSKPEAGTDAGWIDMDLVSNLAQLVIRLGLSEIEIEKGDFKVRVSRMLSSSAAALAPPPHAAPPQTAPPAPAEKETAVVDGPGMVKSPMVGTVYLRPSPAASPFVELGSKVKSGEKLLLVEAMKTFNEILAPREGTVTSILVEDGQPVEYGQPLLVIE